MSRKRHTRAALGILGTLGAALALVAVRPRRRASAPPAAPISTPAAPPALANRPATASSAVTPPHAHPRGDAGSCLLVLGLVAGYVVLSLLMPRGLVGGWVEFRGLDQPPRPTASDYWLQVAVSVTPGILAAIWAWAALGKPGVRARTLLASACGLWTVATSMSFVNGRAHTVTTTDISTRYAVPREAAEFIQAAAYPAVAAILASVIYSFAVALWWSLRPRRSPGLRLSGGLRLTITAVYVVLMLATIIGVGRFEGMEYLG